MHEEPQGFISLTNNDTTKMIIIISSPNRFPISKK